MVDALRVAGVAQGGGEAACDHADAEAVTAALRFAQRRRLGPYASTTIADPRQNEKALAAMVRAGHGFGLARAVLNLAPGTEIDTDDLSQFAGGNR